MDLLFAKAPTGFAAGRIDGMPLDVRIKGTLMHRLSGTALDDKVMPPHTTKQRQLRANIGQS